MQLRSFPRLSLIVAVALTGSASAVIAQNDTGASTSAAAGETAGSATPSPSTGGKRTLTAAPQTPTPAPDTTGSFEVGGVDVDVASKTSEAARQGGWRLAERKGWSMLSQRLTGHPGSLSDGALDGLVTGILVENEYIGGNRYIGRLGVLFDRGRAAAILGVANEFRRSSPMLVVPLLWSGGTARGFERTNPWAEAWSRFRSGESSIDYVRPTGTGPDALLLDLGQTYRRGRGWWRAILDQYSADDILVPEVHLRREWPGGPIIGTFVANHGPDNVRVAQFSLRVSSSSSIDTLLDAGVRRIDQIYQQALSAGTLKTDKLLGYRPPKPEQASDDQSDNSTVPVPEPSATPSVSVTQSVTIQFDTPSAASVSGAEAALRGIPGVRSAITSSLALGGVSVMRVSYDGSLPDLHAALEARGWIVQEGSGVLRIRRAGGADQGGG